jgi:NhaC family Na+:H+ antiporter
MLANLVLSLFLAGLGICIVSGADLLYALLFGTLCFSVYAFYRGYRGRTLLSLLWEGVAKLKNVVLILFLISLITGLWRVCGTIPYIVYHAVSWIDPRHFALWTFLLCCLMSLLTGSALCTSSILGVILMLLARSSGADPLLTGGAAIAGSFFGDRCSPMSSSANLVCAVTGTKLYDNIRAMLRSGAVPFLLTIAVYLLIPARSPAAADTGQLSYLADAFVFRWPVLLPVAAIILLSLLRVDVKIAMTVSLLLSILVGAAVQGLGAAALLRAAVFGYSGGAGMELLSGGGALSMVHVAAIVLLSSTYLGIFRATGLLDGFHGLIGRMASSLSPHSATVLASLPVAAVSSNQNLGIMLTEQLCASSFEKHGEAALAIEDSIVLTAALIPWNIAAAAPMALMGVGHGCLKYAFFLYTLPFVNGVSHTVRHRLRQRRSVSAGHVAK